MLNLPFLKKKQEKTNKFLCVSLCVQDVRCLAFYYDGETYRIIGSGKHDIPQGSIRNGIIINEEIVEEAVLISISQATEELEEPINDVLVGISGNQSLGLTTTIKAKRPQRSQIDSKEVEDIYSKIAEAAYIQAQNEYLQSTGNPDNELEIITSSNVYLKADGKKVDDIENLEVSSLEMAIYNAFSPKIYLETIQEVLKKSGVNIRAVAPEIYSLNQWIRKSHPGVEDFIIIDIGTESTNVAVVFGGGIVSTKTLDIGYIHFVEAISENMGLTFKEAEKVIKGYTLGQLTESETLIIRDCLKEPLDIWLIGMELLFGEFVGVKTFAPKVYLTGKSICLKEITDKIKSEPWTKSIPFKLPPEFKEISLQKLDKLIDSTGRINTSDWINTAAISIIYEEIQN